jgi:cathepsin K
MRYRFLFSLAVTCMMIAFVATAAAPIFGQQTVDERIAAINKRNAELGFHWTAGRTSVSDLSPEEKKKLLGLLPLPEGWGTNIPSLAAPDGATFPAAFDWRALDGVSPITNQEDCGSCWAFAAVAQLESHTLIYDKRLEDLSEQQVVDCNTWGANCGGGWVPAAYDLFISPGSVSETCYPYEARDDKPCRQGSCQIVSQIASYNSVTNTVSSIKTALATGPVTTAFAVLDDFYDYTSGCYDSKTPGSINHAMLIIGWDDNQCAGQGAWIVKNSWGPSWGMGGFAYIKYGTCGIGSFAYQISYLPNTVLVHLDSPNGGEIWNVGEEYQIEWYTERQTPDSLSILLSLNGGVDYDRTIAHGLIGVSSYDWTVPELPVNTAKIKVVAYYDDRVGGYDMSDTDFTIKGTPYRYVSKSGTNIYPYSLPQWAATSIQDAVGAGVPGDTIAVAAGTYREAVVVTKPLYLLGGWNDSFTVREPAIQTTKILGPKTIVSFMNISSGICGVEGFTLKMGTGTSAQIPGSGVYGGAVLGYLSSPIIKENTIDSCGVAAALDFSGGGAIACYGGDALIEGNTITRCKAQSGGGIYLYQSTATIRDNRISDCHPNAAYTGTKQGGGVYADHSPAAFEGNRIEDNDGYRKGCGVYLYMGAASFDGDTIAMNDGQDAGGGIFAERAPLSVSRALVRRNTSTSSGGGIYHRAGNILITNSIIVSNSASIISGGLYADSCWGEITNNTFDRNRATYGGGNMYVGTMPSLTISNNLITYGSKHGFQASNMDNIAFIFNNCFGNTPLDIAMPVAADSTNTSRNPLYADTTSLDYHLLVHSGGIDTGDPSGPNDPDGSRADQGAYGGPGALMAAPEYVRNLETAPGPDTLSSDFYLLWDEPAGGVVSYAVYGDSTTGFSPDESNCIGSVGAPACSLLVSGVSGLHYFRVSAVNGAGYGGGYSNQVTAYGWDDIPPSVTIIYPNGGGILETGDTIRIDWTATDNRRVDSVSIYYSEDAGSSYALIAQGWNADSSYAWIVPSSLSDSCLVKVVAYDPAGLTGFDTSDSLFAIRDYTDVHDSGGGEDGGTPRYVTGLEQNYPNPFNGTTTMYYSVAERCEVELRIYDPAGRLIKVLEQRERAPGRYLVIWNGTDGAGRGVASGVYFCRIKAGKYSQTRKVLYLR